MSDQEEGGRRDAELDRIDALVSAAMDDELDSDEREELRALIAQDEELAARARAFHHVDASLRAMAADLLPEERLAEGLAALGARLNAANEAGTSARIDGADRQGGVELPADSPPPTVEAMPVDRPRLLRNRFAPIAWAAAAAIALYLLVPQSGPEQPQGGTTDSTDSTDYAEYADDASPASLAPGIPLDDLEIIEQLELLEFLAARESQEERG